LYRTHSCLWSSWVFLAPSVSSRWSTVAHKAQSGLALSSFSSLGSYHLVPSDPPVQPGCSLALSRVATLSCALEPLHTCSLYLRHITCIWLIPTQMMVLSAITMFMALPAPHRLGSWRIIEWTPCRLGGQGLFGVQ
jgi:hypothetical protein